MRFQRPYSRDFPHASPAYKKMKRSSVATNTLAQLAGKVTTLIISLVTTAVIYRTLGTTQYGAYVFVTSFVLFFATIADWGTEIITLREVSKDLSNQERIIISSLLLRLFLSFFTVILADLAIHLLPQWRPFVSAVTLFSLALIAVALKVSTQPLFLARGKAIFGAITEVINNSLYFLFIIVFLQQSPSLRTALTLLIIATLIAGLVSWAFASKFISLSLHFSKDFALILIKESLPTGALLALFYIYNRIDIVLLQNFQGNEVIGNYGLAYKIHDNLVQGAAFLMNAVFPLIAVNIPFDRFKSYYLHAFNTLFIAGCTLIAFVTISGPLVINLVGGPAAGPAIPILQILVFATAIAYLNHLTGYTLIAIGHQRTSLLIAFIALLVNVIGNLLLIPLFSSFAAAIMTIVTEGSVFLLSTVAIYRYTHIAPSLKFLPQTISLALKTRGRLFEQTGVDCQRQAPNNN